jgi:vancomycin permeability regulator SanA
MLQLKRLAWFFLIWFVCHSIYIVIDGLVSSSKNADAAVVMGTKVNTDGTLSHGLQARVDCAYELYKAGRVRYIMVSGGRGSEGYDEAEVMKTYLLGKGVPEDAIVPDNMGSNTLATVKNTIQPARTYNWKYIIVVSQYYHISRAKMFFGLEGFENVYDVSPVYFEWLDPYYIFREFWAFYIGLLGEMF